MSELGKISEQRAADEYGRMCMIGEAIHRAEHRLTGDNSYYDRAVYFVDVLKTMGYKIIKEDA